MRDDFFIGWADATPPTRRRFFGLAAAGAAGAATLALGFGARGTPGGDGGWDQSAFQSFEGALTAKPYPMLRTRTPQGGVQSLLLAAQGKCGVRQRVAEHEGRAVRLRGSLIARGKRGMIALADADWLETLPGPSDPQLASPSLELLEQITLQGEILDAKCWLGAMRPGHGKPHKACARLCIKSGAPPAFFAFAGPAPLRALLLMDSDGGPANARALPLVGDPVRLTGRLVRQADVLYLRL